MKKIIIKSLSLLLAISVLLCGCAKSTPTVVANQQGWNTNYKYVFVHGLSGWGSYDFQNKFVKYWGMFGGDLLKELEKQGFDCYSASVNPQGSAWDRACELYAQLTGSVVDYGVEHSERCKHERFGTDYTKKPLIDSWSSEDKINLLGHSFGGATIRMLSYLMDEGSQAEIEATDENDISPLFTGGKGDWIFSMVALAAPHNGTSAYEANDDTKEDLTFMQSFMSSMVSSSTSPNTDGRIESDYASYDLKIDNALKLNETLTTQENLYYFSIPCSSTELQENGTHYPNAEITDNAFFKSALKIGKYTGKTVGGFEITAAWQENDGLVNTISATAPFNAPSVEYSFGAVDRGVWNVMPTFTGDHMSLQGGLFKTHNMIDYYINLLNMINSLEQ